jgi:hypothetical protein
MDDRFDIPAATIEDVNLIGVDVGLASEIRRLGELMERGEETPQQFAQLVRLVYQAGQSRKAEYLLRRNIEVVIDGFAMYNGLFGTNKPDEFASAIEGFTTQFAVRLQLVDSQGFLDSVYQSDPQRVRFDDLRLLNEPCEVRINYASEEAVEADVSSMETDEYMILRWVNGVWEIIEPSSD